MNDTETRAPAALAPLSLRELLDRLSSSDPVPGGGSAAALAGAMGASLVSMVAALTAGRAEYTDADAAAREIGEAASSVRDERHAYHAERGPRLTMVVETSIGPATLVFDATARRWYVETVDQAA